MQEYVADALSYGRDWALLVSNVWVDKHVAVDDGIIINAEALDPDLFEQKV